MGKVGAADGAAEEHRGGVLAEMGEELLELGRVAPAAHAQILPELVESLGVGCQLAVADLADKGGRIVAVDEPVRILPGVEAGGAAGDLVQDLPADPLDRRSP